VAGTEMTVGQLVTDLAKDVLFFNNSGGGVTLSGGEPAAQPRFSYNFLLSCQQHHIHTALETSGYAPARTIAKLAGVSNLILYDVKTTDAECHRLFTGVSNQLILENLHMLCAYHVFLESTMVQRKSERWQER
jgi:pyruvate formate lyase activating enzyme